MGSASAVPMFKALAVCPTRSGDPARHGETPGCRRAFVRAAMQRRLASTGLGFFGRLRGSRRRWIKFAADSAKTRFRLGRGSA
jgi:hypothetical protein